MREEKICVMETQWHDRSDIAGFSLSKELSEIVTGGTRMAMNKDEDSFPVRLY